MREDEKKELISYLGLGEATAFIDVKESILLKLYESKAQFAVIPFQDIFGLGEEHRINLPGTFGNLNWSWRMPFTLEELINSSPDSERGKAAAFIKEISSKTNRNGKNEADEGTDPVIYPHEGTIQKRKRGEFFNVWIICPYNPENLTISSDIDDDKVKARFYREFVDGRYLYGGNLKAGREGTFSLTLDADGKIYRIADCLSCN